MNKLRSYFLALLVTASPLLADATAFYPIGTADRPVIAEEYYSFLCDSTSVQSDVSLEKDFFGTESLPITYTGAAGSYQFSIDQTQWNQAIEAVPSEKAQTLFNAWRQNPTVQELCAYLNDRMHIQLKLSLPTHISPWSGTTYAADSLSITTCYPSSVTLPQADEVVGSYWAGSVYSFVTEDGEIVFSLTRNQLLTMEASFTAYQNTIDDHRPILILRDGQPLPQ